MLYSLNVKCLLLIVILRSNSSKSKAESPRTPSSPLTPTFASSICLLAPCYLTGDSVRDKCVEMLSAALKADGERAWARDEGGKGFLFPISPRADEIQSFSAPLGMVQEHCSSWHKQASLPMLCLADTCISRISFRWLQGLWSQLWQDGIRNRRSYPWIVPGLWVSGPSSSTPPRCKRAGRVRKERKGSRNSPCSAPEPELLILSNINYYFTPASKTWKWAVPHLVLITTPQGRFPDLSSFMGEVTETQRGRIIPQSPYS